MTDPADLIAFLRAQLDHDERVARAAAGDGAEWRYSDSGIYPSSQDHPGPLVVGPYDYLDEEHGEHIALHDPARELAEVDAKRQILDLHPYAGLRSAPESCGTCACIPGPCDTVRLLALPYADRDGYRPEWRPR